MTCTYGCVHACSRCGVCMYNTIHTKWTQSRRREGEKGMLRIEDDVAARGEGPSKGITNSWREMK